MKKLVLLIMLIMCTLSSFSINVESPHLLTSSNYRDCDDDDDHHDDEDDDDDDAPALINGYAYILLIVGCIYIFKTTSNKKE